MTSPVILCTHLVGAPSRPSARWATTPLLCDADTDYAAGVAAAWSTDRVLINIEQDIQATDDHIQALLDCPHPVCAWSYLVYAASGIHDAPAYPFVARQPGPWVTYGTEWAEWAAPGFIKIAPTHRRGPFPAHAHWLDVEHATNALTTGPWHLHWPPVEHDHKE